MRKKNTEILYDEDGRIYHLRTNRLFTGKYVEWFDDGQKELEIDIKEGLIHGKAIFWHQNNTAAPSIFGRRRIEANYRNDEEHGKTIEWDRSGQVVLEEEWDNGELVSKFSAREEIEDAVCDLYHFYYALDYIRNADDYVYEYCEIEEIKEAEKDMEGFGGYVL